MYCVNVYYKKQTQVEFILQTMQAVREISQAVWQYNDNVSMVVVSEIKGDRRVIIDVTFA